MRGVQDTTIEQIHVHSGANDEEEESKSCSQNATDIYEEELEEGCGGRLEEMTTYRDETNCIFEKADS